MSVSLCIVPNAIWSVARSDNSTLSKTNASGNLKLNCAPTIGSMLFIVIGTATILSAIPSAEFTCNSFTENGSATTLAFCTPFIASDVTDIVRLIAPQFTGAYCKVILLVPPIAIVNSVSLNSKSSSSIEIDDTDNTEVPTFFNVTLRV